MCILNPNKSSQPDIKLWFLPHISTEAIQAAIDAKALILLYQLNWVPRAIDVRDKNAGLNLCGASVNFKKSYLDIMFHDVMIKKNLYGPDWLIAFLSLFALNLLYIKTYYYT